MVVETETVATVASEADGKQASDGRNRDSNNSSIRTGSK